MWDDMKIDRKMFTTNSNTALTPQIGFMFLLQVNITRPIMNNFYAMNVNPTCIYTHRLKIRYQTAYSANICDPNQIALDVNQTTINLTTALHDFIV